MQVPLSKVKFNAKHEYEYVANFKVLQSVFDKHKIENAIPVERLMKCKFQDNLEFLQWMKKFWDQYYPGGSYDALPRRKADGAAMGSRPPVAKSASPAVGGGASVKKTMSTSSVGAPRKAAASSASAPRAAAAAGPAHSNGGVGGNDAQRAELIAEYQKMTNEMTQQIMELKVTVEQVEKEREFYFSKLREIEMYIQSRVEAGIDEHLDDAFKEVQSIMYKTEDGFEIPDAAEDAVY
nr:hypothetical protein HK105_002462 [Polyrhizophydium stewartii]